MYEKAAAESRLRLARVALLYFLWRKQAVDKGKLIAIIVILVLVLVIIGIIF